MEAETVPRNNFRSARRNDTRRGHFAQSERSLLDFCKMDHSTNARIRRRMLAQVLRCVTSAKLQESEMPRGDKSAYSNKQKRQAEHIEESYKKRGVSSKTAAGRAWATVNKETGGGKKGGAKKKTATKSSGRKIAAKKGAKKKTATRKSAAKKTSRSRK
jgi:plasmid stabilization system protein ParE